MDVKNRREAGVESGRLWHGDADADDHLRKLMEQLTAVEQVLVEVGLPPMEVVALLVPARRGRRNARSSRIVHNAGIQPAWTEVAAELPHLVSESSPPGASVIYCRRVTLQGIPRMRDSLGARRCCQHFQLTGGLLLRPAVRALVA